MNSILIPLLVFVAVMILGGSVLLSIRERRRPLQDRLRGLVGSPQPATEPYLAKRFVEALNVLGSSMGSNSSSPQLREQLARAGFHHADAARIYMGAKLLSLLTGAILLGAAAMLS